MGIAEAITRVRDRALIEGETRVRAGLERALRRDRIPGPLQPVARKLADLLKVRGAVVSLDAAIATQAANAHGAVGHDEMIAAGGVCPFSGLNATMASLFEAEGFEVVHASEAASEKTAGAAWEAEPKLAEGASVAETAKKEARLDAVTSAEPAPVAGASKGQQKPRPRAASSRAKPTEDAKKPSARSAAWVATKLGPKSVAAPLAAPAKKKAQVRAEKVVGALAEKPSSSKTPARSTVEATARPATKRPIAKVAKKKDSSGL